MLSRKELRRQINLRIFGSPATLVPLLGGGVALASPLFFSIAPAVPIFLGITGLVAAGGNVLIQSLLSREKIVREILDESESQDHANREADLSRLHSKLSADGDARTQKLLSDLRALVGAIHEGSWRTRLNGSAVADIQRGVDTLYNGALATLRRTLELTEMIRKLGTPAAKKTLVAERSTLIEEVIESVAELTKFMTRLDTVAVTTHTSEDLGQIVKGLESDLEIARHSMEQAAALTVSPHSDVSFNPDLDAPETET
jgi:hypothetical protein